MKIIMLYRPNSEHAGRAEDYVAEYSRRHPGKNIEMIDVDSPVGSEKAKIYDITSYPAVLAVRDDGSPAEVWQDERLPLMSEIEFYQQS